MLDAKWDILAHKLPVDWYHDLFRRQLTDGSKTAEAVRAMLDKYSALMGKDYAEVFETYTSCEGAPFSLL